MPIGNNLMENTAFSSPLMDWDFIASGNDIPLNGLIERYKLAGVVGQQAWSNAAPYARSAQNGSAAGVDTNDATIASNGATFGADDYILKDSIGSLLNGSPIITVIIPFKQPASVTPVLYLYLSRIAAGAENGIEIWTGSTLTSMRCKIKSATGDTAATYTSPANFAAGSWALAAFEIDYAGASTKVQHYKNGVYVETSGSLALTASAYTSAYSTALMDQISYSSFPINGGIIFETAVYNRALSASEHAQIAAYYSSMLKSLGESIPW